MNKVRRGKRKNNQKTKRIKKEPEEEGEDVTEKEDTGFSLEMSESSEESEIKL